MARRAVHPEWPDNKAFNYHQEGGEVDKAFAEADVIVKQRITSQRLIPTAMETRGVVAEWRAADRQLNLYSSTQIPHLMRTLVAQMLGLEENRLRVVTPEVGGGFGSKLNVYAEEALMGFVAMKIGKPVKWIESRRENFLCTIHGRGHVDYYEVAAKKDGTITGIKLLIIQDLGAYHQLLTPAIPTLSVLMMPGLYKTAEYSRRYYRGVHQLRSDRCVSRRGAAGGDARDRAHGRYSGGGIEDGSGGDSPEEFHSEGRVSVPDGDGVDLRFGRLFAASQESAGDGGL